MIKNVLHIFLRKLLPGDHYEGIPFAEANSRPDKTLLITRKTFLIIRSDAGGLRPPDPLAILMIFISQYAKDLDLAETIPAVQSRASGRPSLSRYGHFSVDNQPLPKKNIFNPKTFLSYAGVI